MAKRKDLLLTEATTMRMMGLAGIGSLANPFLKEEKTPCEKCGKIHEGHCMQEGYEDDEEDELEEGMGYEDDEEDELEERKKREKEEDDEEDNEENDLEESGLVRDVSGSGSTRTPSQKRMFGKISNKKKEEPKKPNKKDKELDEGGAIPGMSVSPSRAELVRQHIEKLFKAGKGKQLEDALKKLDTAQPVIALPNEQTPVKESIQKSMKRLKYLLEIADNDNASDTAEPSPSETPPPEMPPAMEGSDETENKIKEFVKKLGELVQETLGVEVTVEESEEKGPEAPEGEAAPPPPTGNIGGTAPEGAMPMAEAINRLVNKVARRVKARLMEAKKDPKAAAMKAKKMKMMKEKQMAAKKKEKEEAAKKKEMEMKKKKAAMAKKK